MHGHQYNAAESFVVLNVQGAIEEVIVNTVMGLWGKYVLAGKVKGHKLTVVFNGLE